MTVMPRNLLFLVLVLFTFHYYVLDVGASILDSDMCSYNPATMVDMVNTLEIDLVEN